MTSGLSPIHSVPPVPSTPPAGYCGGGGVQPNTDQKSFHLRPGMKKGSGDRLLSVRNKGWAEGHRILSGKTTQDSAPGEGRDCEASLCALSPRLPDKDHSRERQGDRCKQLHAHPGNPSCIPRTVSIAEGELNPSLASAMERMHQNSPATAPDLRTQTLGEP